MAGLGALAAWRRHLPAIAGTRRTRRLRLGRRASGKTPAFFRGRERARYVFDRRPHVRSQSCPSRVLFELIMHGMQTATAASDLDILLGLNEDYIQSVQRSDVARFEQILADDFLATLADGRAVDRSAFLAQTAKPVTISNLAAHDVNV